jgi:polyisoprenoid-binding protein YceI
MPMIRNCTLSAILLCSAFGAAAQEKIIDTQRSSLTIHVGKAGLFSAAAHEHWVTAPFSSGTINDAAPSVRFVVEARALAVKPEKGLSEKDHAEVQSTMQTKVLEAVIYPRIVFQSTEVHPAGARAWRVSGNLSLHGVTKPVAVDVRIENDAYVGTARIKQTDFGIQPIKIGGGVVKVKDELEIQFQVYTAAR